jgi:hypothetical protein
VIDDLLELHGSFGVLPCSPISLRTSIWNVQGKFVWLGFRKQIRSLNGVSSLALDDRTNQRQMNFLSNRILGTHPIQFRGQRFRLRQVAGIPECIGTTPELTSAQGTG